MSDRKLFAAAVFTLAMIATPLPAQAADTDAYDRLLSHYVVASADGINRVRYTAWKASADDVRALNDYIASLERDRPSRMTRDEQLAHWINLYNAITLQVILENYPVRSIRDIRSQTLDPRGLIGPWRTQRVTVEGRRLTLDQIENSILRPEFNEPRIHYAINCASIGCPNLAARAWRAETMEADLTRAARAYVNHPRGVSIDPQGRVRVSTIYRWFAGDFGGNTVGVLTHLRRYASPELQARLDGATAISHYGYDWTLNDTN
ncbi:MAG: DUF547 domain-containing protein [Hyphomonadaceae bacterium JAD_PAG50586_4]|nr:MAG: DUF547 domain-containing protein [Hyphomonadaceae bacterium JAD_PAG50586_4]